MAHFTPSDGGDSWWSALARRVRQQAGSLKIGVLLVSALALAASVLLSSHVLIDRLGGRAESAVAELERATVAHDATQLDQRLRQTREALAAALAGVTWSREVTPREAAAFLSMRPVLAAMFDGVVLAAVDGRVLAKRQSPHEPTTAFELADAPYFRRALDLGRAGVSGLVGDGDAARIWMTQPVRDAHGTIVAVLCGALRPVDLDLDMSAHPDQRAAVRTVVVDATGRVLVHPQAQRRREPIDREPGLADVVARWRAQGSPVLAQAEVQVTPDHFVSMAGVPSVEWTVFRIAATDVLLGQPKRARLQALALAAGFALVGGLLIMAVLRRLLRPLRLLEQRAHALLDGSLPADQGWPEAHGEIGALSRVLQHVMRERAQAELYTADLLQKMRSVMAAAPIGIAFVNRRHFELVSHEYAALLGCEPEDMIGHTAERFFADSQDYHQMRSSVSEAFAAGHTFSSEALYVRKDGTKFWGRNQGRPVKAGDSSMGTIWLLADVTREREARERLTWSATHDPLTRLLNRSAFEAALNERLAARTPGQPDALLFIDLDRFKHINDSAGHAAGDAVLEKVAQVLSHRVRVTDRVGRLGGDEFAVLLSGCDRPLALRIAEQIRAGIEEAHVAWVGERLAVGASIGVVEMPEGSTDPAALLAAADAACYEAKHAGRNTVREARSAGGLRLVAGRGGAD